MRKTLQRRPGFEALESITLLSGLAGAAVSTAAPNPIHLSGLIRIEATLQSVRMAIKRNLPSSAEKGSGSISPLGHVTESGDTWLLGLSPSATLTLNARAGKVFVSIGAPLGSDTLQYAITGGTKAYAGATGFGNFQFAVLGHGKFAARFS
jgi:hypothetical protein